MKAINKIRFFPVLLIIYFLFNLSSYAQNSDSNFVIGKYKIKKIVDGDTFNFENLDVSTRLLCIDTEEIFKGKDAEEKTNDIAYDWPEYYNEKKGDTKMPVKSNSPFGYTAYQWAKEFMDGVDSVTLELDSYERTIDLYNRGLVYVIVEKNGQRINFNLECVRNGYSPYFVKYGNSKRFHTDFLNAQEEAKANKAGIWNVNTKCYPDYPQRLTWWETRAKQLQEFENHSKDEKYFDLMSREYSDLENYLGSEIIIFGTISETISKENKFVFVMTRKRGETLDLITYSENFDILKQLDIDSLKEYYIYAKGKLEKNSQRYFVKIKSAGQIRMN